MDNNGYNNYNDQNNNGQQPEYAEYTVYEENDGSTVPPLVQAQQQSAHKKKRVTKEMARKRQLTALGIIIAILILLFILIAKGCAKDDSSGGGGAASGTVTTTSEEAAPVEDTETEAATEPETEAPTVNPEAANVKLTAREIFLDVGETGISIIQAYPKGSDEENEVWKSSDESIATVDKQGYVTAKAPGECYVILSFDNNPGIEIEIKISVAEGVTQTSNEDNETASPLDAASGKDDIAAKGLHYFDGVLIANKSYSLPEDYDPGLDSKAEAAFDALSAAAAEEGLYILMGSNYRSYWEQEELYNNFLNWYGQEYADNYSARPGYSEHQTGLAIDCTSYSEVFGATMEAQWLAGHAHEYGFIIRYPQGKEWLTGYSYEPWHIRYVGRELAEELYSSGQCLEEYLGIDSYYHD